LGEDCDGERNEGEIDMEDGDMSNDRLIGTVKKNRFD
jgi:hypothetical protein